MTTQGKYILAIDLGTTCFKAALFDKSLLRVATSKHYLTYISNDSKVELAVSEVRLACRNIIRGLLKSTNIKGHEIRAVGITGQAQTFLLAEKGEPVMDFISWKDSRGSISGEVDVVDFQHHSSYFSLLPGLQISHLIRLSDSNLIKPSYDVVSLPSFLIWELCGKLVSDHNLAAMSGMYSLEQGDWHVGYLKRCGLHKGQMGVIIPVGAKAGNTGKSSTAYGLIHGIPIYSCGNDQTSGAFGANLTEDAMLMTLGSAQVLYQVTDQMPDPQPGLTRGLYPGGRHYRLVRSNGGRLISRVVELKEGINNYDDFFDKASVGKADPNFQVDETTGEIFYGRDSSPEDIAFSCLLYLCETMKGMYENLTAINGETQIVLVAGGGARNKVWLDMLKELLDLEFILIEADPLDGAARMTDEDFEVDSGSMNQM